MNKEELERALRSPASSPLPADGHTILERARVHDRIVQGAVGGATLLSILLIAGLAMWQRPAPDLTPRGAGGGAPPGAFHRGGGRAVAKDRAGPVAGFRWP